MYVSTEPIAVTRPYHGVTACPAPPMPAPHVSPRADRGPPPTVARFPTVPPAGPPGTRAHRPLLQYGSYNSIIIYRGDCRPAERSSRQGGAGRGPDVGPIRYRPDACGRREHRERSANRRPPCRRRGVSADVSRRPDRGTHGSKRTARASRNGSREGPRAGADRGSRGPHARPSLRSLRRNGIVLFVSTGKIPYM